MASSRLASAIVLFCALGAASAVRSSRDFSEASNETQAYQTEGDCPATCNGPNGEVWTCDNWVDQGWDCGTLQNQHGCDCRGCSRCEACAKTCHGYSCDEWVAAEPSKNSCQSLQRDFFCDCSGCACEPAAPATNSNVASNQGPSTYNYDVQAAPSEYNTAAYTYDQQESQGAPTYDYGNQGSGYAYDDSKFHRPQIVDVSNEVVLDFVGYTEVGNGQCLGPNGREIAMDRKQYTMYKKCAELCDKDGSKCFGFAADDVTCLLYRERVSSSTEKKYDSMICFGKTSLMGGGKVADKIDAVTHGFKELTAPVTNNVVTNGLKKLTGRLFRN